METKALYNIAENKGITIDFLPLPENTAMSLKMGEKFFIAIDKAVIAGSAAERVALAHELGHIFTNAFYSPISKISERIQPEQLAERWAINTLVPFDELKKAVKSDGDDIHNLSEHFGVTADFLQKALKYYFERA